MSIILPPNKRDTDSVVKEAMSEYWRMFVRVGDRQGHFVRRSDNIISWDISKAVDTLTKQPPRLRFMAV